MAQIVQELETFVLERLQHAILKEDWSALRIVFGFLHCEFPARAKELYDRMSSEIQSQLFNYKKGHDDR